jgi:hypothetical protein
VQVQMYELASREIGKILNYWITVSYHERWVTTFQSLLNFLNNLFLLFGYLFGCFAVGWPDASMLQTNILCWVLNSIIDHRQNKESYYLNNHSIVQYIFTFIFTLWLRFRTKSLLTCADLRALSWCLMCSCVREYEHIWSGGLQARLK